MTLIFLTTIISCNQLLGIINRVFFQSTLTYHQRIEVIVRLQKYIPYCPVIIKNNESKGTASN